MKKAALSLLVLLVFAAVAPAQEQGGFVAPWSAPVPGVDAGTGLISIGFWADVVGLGLIAGAAPAYSLGIDVGNGFFATGLISLLLVGNPCLQIGLQQHHDALVAQGFEVSTENQEKSRRFHYISLGCGGASLAMGLVSIGMDGYGLTLASFVVGAVGAGFEIFNFYIHRRNWGLDMKEAAGIAVP